MTKWRIACAAALLLTGLLTWLTGASVAWWLLVLTALPLVAVLQGALRSGRLLEPLPILSAVSLLTLVMRPLYLFLHASDLSSFRPPASAVGALQQAETQEIALYLTRFGREAFAPLAVRVTAAVTIFVLCIAAGYLAATRVPRPRVPVPRWRPAVDLKAATVVALALGLVGQAALLARLGGPLEALNHIRDQSSLGESFPLMVLATSSVVGLLLWGAARWPVEGWQRILFWLLVLETGAFFAITGSRARVLMVVLLLLIVRNYRLRPWTVRQMLATGVCVAVCASSFLAVRQAVATEPLPGALTSAPAYLLSPDAFINDQTAWDNLMLVIDLTPRPIRFQRGDSMVRALRSYIPSAITPDKPESGDVWFRKRVWGADTGAGRPYTVIGELWLEFGLAGVIVGALLLGALLRGLTALMRQRAAHSPLLAVLGAIGTFLAFELLLGVWSITLGFALALLLPLAAAQGAGIAAHAVRSRLSRGGAALAPQTPS